MRTDNRTKSGGHVAWDVVLRGRVIDTVFWCRYFDGGAEVTAQDVRDSLVNHDGYSPGIQVRRAK